jgi:hypothetical protein
MSYTDRRAENKWGGDKGNFLGWKGMDLKWVFERDWRDHGRVKSCRLRK